LIKSAGIGARKSGTRMPVVRLRLHCTATPDKMTQPKHNANPALSPRCARVVLDRKCIGFLTGKTDSTSFAVTPMIAGFPGAGRNGPLLWYALLNRGQDAPHKIYCSNYCDYGASI
jgi:hypothetical protein